MRILVWFDAFTIQIFISGRRKSRWISSAFCLLLAQVLARLFIYYREKTGWHNHNTTLSAFCIYISATKSQGVSHSLSSGFTVSHESLARILYSLLSLSFQSWITLLLFLKMWPSLSRRCHLWNVKILIWKCVCFTKRKNLSKIIQP